MDTRIDRLQGQLSSEGPLPVYLVCGSESLLRSEALKRVEEAVLGEGLADFNHDRVELGREGLDVLLDAAFTAPMMSSRRLVSVRLEDTPKGEVLEGLKGYMGDPCPTTTLLLHAPSIDGRSALCKAADRQGGLLRFDPLRPRDVIDWLISRAEFLGCGIQRDAAALLADVSGNDLQLLDTTLEKLVVHVGGQRRLERADVEACVTRTREEVIWDLTDAVGERELRKALVLVHRMIDGGQSGILIVAMIARHFRQLWKVKSHGDSGLQGKDIAAAAGVRPFVVGKLQSQAQKFPNRILLGHFERLYRADRDLKSSRLGEALILESLVLGLCGGQTRA